MDPSRRKILEQPFPPEALKQRRGASGKTFTYAEVQLYIDKLNLAFSGDWSWEVLRREIVDDQIIVEGRLSADGVTKTGIGGSSVTRRRDDGSAISLADDIKKGEADALKRACRLLGIAGQLYTGEEDEIAAARATPRTSPPMQAAMRPHAPPAATRGPRSSSDGPEERGRITTKQLNAIWAIARSQGYTDTEFRSYCVEQFGAQPEYLSRTFASQLIDRLGHGGNGHAERRPGEVA